jgi:hypothetical protein
LTEQYDFHEISYVKRVITAVAVVMEGVSRTQKEVEAVDPEV